MNRPIETELSVRDGPLTCQQRSATKRSLGLFVLPVTILLLIVYLKYFHHRGMCLTQSTAQIENNPVTSTLLYLQYVSDERGKTLGFSLSQVAATLMDSHVILLIN